MFNKYSHKPLYRPQHSTVHYEWLLLFSLSVNKFHIKSLWKIKIKLNCT